ncbi:GTP-binding protein [Paenibacillus beijingensis]|uniref:CobW C-terminal domain-containing protein n=1 Tax=Paenibacillus beijingensis TaxID=1126833 RepID=A0A0D5NFF6_9BACL|nr:GTP-binding protein [Paenibacillus beijingensis]AJY73885.1 hypothetical protein VN24_03745 [Paenibacillus beijingensis]
MRESRKPIPVIVLAGFLGSGKTTLLTRLLERCKTSGLKPAVIVNELGEVNLDGMLVERDVPMAEMLGGCICCTSRGDLGMEIMALVQQHEPDVILIESTGAASPLEMIDGITEAAMMVRISLETIVTVVDGPELLRLGRSGKGRTYKLQRDGIVCATSLVLNKTDLLQPDERVEAEQLLRELNRYAPVVAAVRCDMDERWLDDHLKSGAEEADLKMDMKTAGSCSTGEGKHAPGCGCGHDDHGHEHGAHPHGEHSHEHGARSHSEHDHEHGARSYSGHGHEHGAHPHDEHSHEHGAHSHSGHDHVMAVTCYLDGPVDSEAFEAFLRKLPDNVYRAKGIVTFTDTASRFLFQYAYREVDFLAIRPQGDVKDVAVFIGEHFVRDEVVQPLEQLIVKSDGVPR